MAKKSMYKYAHYVTYVHTYMYITLYVCELLKYLCQVKSQLSKAFEPALTSVEVLWQQFDDNAPKPIQVITNN